MIGTQGRLRDYVSGKKWLIAILIACFFLSIGYSFFHRIEPQVDALAYDLIAQNIVDGHGYRVDPDVPLVNDNSILRVGPIYEYFLAYTYKVFGHHHEVVWILQALLRVLSVLFLYLAVLLIFAEKEYRNRVALWSCAIFAFHPDLIEISAMLMTETLYIFFVCLMLYTFFKYVQQPKFLLLVILGVVSGLAVLARPPVLFCLPVVFFYLYKKRSWKEIVIFAAIICVVFVPWTVRNYKIYNEVIPFGIAGDLNFWIGNHVGADGEQGDGIRPGQIVIGEYGATHTPVEVGNESMRQFKKFVIENPIEFIKLTTMRVVKYFSLLRPMGFWFYSSGIEKALFILSSAAFSSLLIIMSLGGVIYAIRTREHALYYLLGFTVLTPLIIFITVVETRYRFQVYPLLAIFAGYFIEHRSKGLWAKILLASLIIVLLNSGIDGIVNFDTFKEKLLNYK